MADDNVDPAFREGQIRMEGKLDRIGDAVQRQADDMRDLRVTVHGHGNRLGVLEAHKHITEGERRGVAFSGRITWGLLGLIPGGAIVAALMKLLGS